MTRSRLTYAVLVAIMLTVMLAGCNHHGGGWG